MERMGKKSIQDYLIITEVDTIEDVIVMIFKYGFDIGVTQGKNEK